MASILVVESETRNHFSILPILEKAGYFFRTIENSKEAIEHLQKSEFEIVIFDAVLCASEKLDPVASFLKADPCIQLILLCDESTDHLAMEALKQGALDYHVEPFRSDQVVKSIQQAEQFLRLKKGMELLTRENQEYRQALVDMINVRSSTGQATAKGLEDEETSQEELERLQSIILNSTEMIILMNLDGSPSFISPQSERIFGYPPGQFIGNRIKKIVHPGDVAISSEAFAGVPAWETSLENEYRIFSNEGKVLWIHHTTRTLYTEGRPCGVQHNLRNITQWKNQTERLFLENEKLEEKIEILQQKRLLQQAETDRIEREKEKLAGQIKTNVDLLVLPLLEKMKRKGSSFDNSILEMLEKNFTTVSSGFGPKITLKNNSLTKREIEICNLIRTGLASKEIADLLNISYRSVTTHRQKIRKKLGITNKNINLETFLSNM